MNTQPDAVPAIDLSGFLGFQVPSVCWPGITSNLALLLSHLQTLDRYTEQETESEA